MSIAEINQLAGAILGSSIAVVIAVVLKTYAANKDY